MKRHYTQGIRTLLLAAIFTLVAAVACMAQGTTAVPDSDKDRGARVTPYTRKQAEAIYRTEPPLGIKYTKKRPLVIVADWAFPPFSFMNDAGEPAGLIVDIFKEIFSRFHIAYEIRMMDRAEARRHLVAGTAQLMVDIDNVPQMKNVHQGKTIVASYSVAVLRNKNTPMMRSIMLLGKHDTLMVSKDSYSYYYLNEVFGGNIPFVLESTTASGAVNTLMDGTAKYFVWDEAALRSVVNKYGIRDYMQIERIDVPEGKMRFFARDTVLLNRIDLVLQQMQQTGHYAPVYNKWMTGGVPDKRSLSFHVVLFSILVVCVTVLLFVVLRSTLPGRLKTEFRTIARIGVEMSNCQVLAISVKKQWVYNLAGDYLPKGGMHFNDYIALIHPRDVSKIYSVKDEVDSGKSTMSPIHFRMRRHGDPMRQWRDIVVEGSVKSRRGKPVYVFLTLHDETEHLREKRTLDGMLMEYASITDMSDIGRAYYDRKGKMVKYNKAYINFFANGSQGNAEDFVRSTKLRELCIMMNGLFLEKDMDAWLCAPLDIPELSLRGNAEVRVRTVWDEKHENSGYAVMLRDTASALKLHRDVAEAEKTLDKVKAKLQKYKSEIDFIMRRNNVSTFRWEVGGNFIELSMEGPYGRRISFNDYVGRLLEDDREGIMAALKDPEKHITQPMRVLRHIKSAEDPKDEQWYEVCLTPDYDSNGRYVGVFGVRCDVTDFVVTQGKLREQAERAKESGKQKALFLASMTHELRTPLNAINGFAEIMSFLTTDEEKKRYVDIMAHNCTMLISLIDNILQISTIDTEGMKLRRNEVDFAAIFRDKATEMRKYIADPAVAYRIDTPVKSLMLRIDAERIMQVLDIFVNNASKFTTQGFIHVGFRYDGSQITIYCRDTGCGIPQDKQQAIFERFFKIDDFVQGTGLGLSLAKVIADHLGATIDLYSREGEGTVMSLNVSIAPHTEDEQADYMKLKGS